MSASDDRLSVALTKYSGKAKSAAKSVTDSQADSKRTASRRTAILQNPKTPSDVKNKWDEICKLGSRGGKNTKKAEFTDILFKDAGSWTDSYWQASLVESHEKERSSEGCWMLRSKAEQDHGGPVAGKIAIDQAVLAGVYKERFIFAGKDAQGKPIRLSEIRVGILYLHAFYSVS